MATSLKFTATGFFQLKKPQNPFLLPSQASTVPVKKSLLTPMAALTLTPTINLSQTFTKLKNQREVAFIPYITAGDPGLSTTAQALKVLDSSGADMIELGVPHSDPILDVISFPIVLFSYHNPIIKHGIENFMPTISDVGVQGLVVPDAPFEETKSLRKEAVKNNAELASRVEPEIFQWVG
ncbi:hypothetical protein PRUPE_3G144400 [Prunus persica]|uniref:tryptophan synthase n=1 Tax=Prunus persica TaxID=3760 RepID=M5WY47_PRUPE|nr:hypothetical protein PRUPE_3G144400 [Prunus persica]